MLSLYWDVVGNFLIGKRSAQLYYIRTVTRFVPMANIAVPLLNVFFTCLKAKSISKPMRVHQRVSSEARLTMDQTQGRSRVPS